MGKHGIGLNFFIFLVGFLKGGGLVVKLLVTKLLVTKVLGDRTELSNDKVAQNYIYGIIFGDAKFNHAPPP